MSKTSKSRRVGDYAAVAVGDSYDIYVIDEHMQDNLYSMHLDDDPGQPDIVASIQKYAPGAWPFDGKTWLAEL